MSASGLGSTSGSTSWPTSTLGRAGGRMTSSAKALLACYKCHGGRIRRRKSDIHLLQHNSTTHSVEPTLVFLSPHGWSHIHIQSPVHPWFIHTQSVHTKGARVCKDGTHKHRALSKGAIICHFSIIAILCSPVNCNITRMGPAWGYVLRLASQDGKGTM